MTFESELSTDGSRVVWKMTPEIARLVADELPLSDAGFREDASELYRHADRIDGEEGNRG